MTPITVCPPTPKNLLTADRNAPVGYYWAYTKDGAIAHNKRCGETLTPDAYTAPNELVMNKHVELEALE